MPIWRVLQCLFNPVYIVYCLVTCGGDVKCNLHGCKTFIFIFCLSFCVSPFFSFLLHVVGLLLPPSFSQPACRCLQTTWRLTVICSRFPKPTIWARKKRTGLKSHAPVQDTTAAAIQLGGAGTVSNTPTMIMMSLLRMTCGPRMSMAMGGGTRHPVTTGTMAALVVTHLHHVIRKSQDLQGHLRGIPKTRQCAMTHQGDLHLQEGVVSQELQGITLQTIHGIHLVTTIASVPPDRGTHTGRHAASPSSKWTCKSNHQVHTENIYTLEDKRHKPKVYSMTIKFG